MFRLARSAGGCRWLALGFLLLGSTQVAGALWIYAKAQLAQYLIADAWAKTLEREGEPTKPWPWADTWPVGRLQVPDLNVDQYVLAGATGHALAFGPGHHGMTALPGQGATSMLAGHRDTHFSFLRRLRTGTVIQVQDLAGQTHAYTVSNIEIVDSSRSLFVLPTDDRERLLLLTCYPFDAVTSGGKLRYLVSADPVSTAVPSPFIDQEEYHL